MTDPSPSTVELARLDGQAIGAAYERRELIATEVVETLRRRISDLDDAGPSLHSVITLADDIDPDRPGPLAGIPVLVKDNVDTIDLPTTAGSFALTDDRPATEAPIVRRLRAAGAVIVGKANLSEWANFRSTRSSSGWSAVGGLTKNPHTLDRSAGGSSSGSGAAVAAGLVPLAIGTETDGSIMCPAANCGIVGIKPTVGLVPRTGIVPISHTQDTAGPMARSVADAALLLSVIAGTDPGDRWSTDAPWPLADLVSAATVGSLEGVTIGVARSTWGRHPDLDRLADDAVAALADCGATTVDGSGIPTAAALATFTDEMPILLTEFKANINDYLETRPGAPVSTLEELIAFNLDHAAVEMPHFGQETFELAQATSGLKDADYLAALERNRRLAGPEGIGAALEAMGADVLVMPSATPAWKIDLVNGDHSGFSTWQPAAASGYPGLGLPIGFVEGLPVNLSIVGRPWSEPLLVRVAAALEAALAIEAWPAFRPAQPG